MFFIVPDVLLSWLARERLRDGLIGALYALAGAWLAFYVVYFSLDSTRKCNSI